MLAGEHRAAADRWQELGCPLWAAYALAFSEQARDVQDCLEILDRLELPAVRAAVLRDRHARGLMVPRGPRASSRANPSGLTTREADILGSIALGHTVRQTARSLGIAVKTVENTQARLFRKLGAHNRSGALTIAYRMGLVDPAERVARRVAARWPRDSWMLAQIQVARGQFDRALVSCKVALAEGAIGWYPYWLEKADFVYEHHHRWTGADFGDKLPSEVFREHVQTCFIDDSTGLRNRYQIGLDTITWEADYPHSDSTWPESPEVLMKSLEEVGLPDDDIHKVTWKNASRWYQFDPFEHRTREVSRQATLLQRGLQETCAAHTSCMRKDRPRPRN